MFHQEAGAWRLRARALALLGWAVAGASVAQEQVKKPGADTFELSPVVVTATRVDERSFDLPVAIDALDKSVIQEQKPQVLISEDLARVPGTTVQNRGTFSQEEQIVIRGFGARSQFGTRGIKLLADGIPASTPDGQGGSALFNLATAARIEVLRGAFSALYGNHSGGVVQIFTEDGPPRPTLSGRVSVGSYQTLITGIEFGGTSGRADYIADFSHFETEGYRDWSGAKKEQVNGKLNYGLDNGGKLSLIVNYLDQPGNLDPLGLTAEQVVQDRRQASPVALQFQTRRNLDNLQGGLVYEQALGGNDSLRVMGYTGKRSNEQFLAIPTATQNGIRHPGAVAAFDRDFFGGSLWWTHRMEFAGAPLSFTLGGDYDRAAEARQGFLNNFGAQGALKRDEDNTAESWGGFVQGEWQFAPQWSLSAGLRYTDVRFKTEDHFVCTTTLVTAPGTAANRCSGSTAPISATNFNPDDSGSLSHDAWTPVGGLLYRLSPMTNLYASVGKSFETPTLTELAYRPDGGSGFNFALQPSTSWHYELGVKTFLGAETRLNAALFQIATENEIVVATNQGGRTTFQNAGDTRRRGAELSLDTRLGKGFAGYLAATYLEAEFRDSFLACTGVPCNTTSTPPSNVATVNAGNRIPGVPRYWAYGELSWRYAPLGFSTALEAYWQDQVFVNDRNSEAAGSYLVANFRAGFEQQWAKLRLSEFVRVNNLLDREYIGAVIVGDANGRFYAPAAERNYLVGVSASFEF